MATDRVISTVATAAINVAKNGTRALIAAQGANTQIWILGCWLSGSAGNGTMILIDGGSNAMTGTITLTNGVDDKFILPLAPNQKVPWFKCATNVAFNATLSANMDLDGTIVYAVAPIYAAVTVP